MCLMLYAASPAPIALRIGSDISVEKVAADHDVRQWFSLPEVRYVGSHSGCGCGFPSVASETPVEYYDGIFDDAEERAEDLASVHALLGIIDESIAAAGTIELLAIWAGGEGEPPSGVIEVKRAELEAEKFFLMEDFLYRVTA